MLTQSSVLSTFSQCSPNVLVWHAHVACQQTKGGQLSTRILGRRTRLFHLSLFSTASRMVLPKMLVLTVYSSWIHLAVQVAPFWQGTSCAAFILQGSCACESEQQHAVILVRNKGLSQHDEGIMQ